MDSVKKQASEHVEPKITNIAEKLKSGTAPNTTPRAMSMHKDVMPSIGSTKAREPGHKDVMQKKIRSKRQVAKVNRLASRSHSFLIDHRFEKASSDRSRAHDKARAMAGMFQTAAGISSGPEVLATQR